MRVWLLVAVGLLSACCLVNAWPRPSEPVVEIQSMAVTPDGKHLLIGLSDGTKEGVKGEKALIRMIDLEAGKEVKSFIGHKGNVRSLAVTADGKHLVSTGGGDKDGGSVRLWSLKSAKQLRQFDEKGRFFPVAAVSPDGKTVLTSTSERSAKSGTPLTFWDFETGKAQRTMEGPKVSVRGLSFSPDGKLLLFETQLIVIDVKTGEVLKSFDARKEHWSLPAVFSPDSRTLLLQKADSHYDAKPPHDKHYLVLWDVKAEKESSRHLIGKQNHPVDQSARGLWMRWIFFRKDGKRAFVIDDVGGMALLDLKTGKKTWEKKLDWLSAFRDEVFRVSEGEALVVRLKGRRGQLPPVEHRNDGADLVCTWYDLDSGKELKSKEISIKW
jgi:WD40 repeat protein